MQAIRSAVFCFSAEESSPSVMSAPEKDTAAWAITVPKNSGSDAITRKKKGLFPLSAAERKRSYVRRCRMRNGKISAALPL